MRWKVLDDAGEVARHAAALLLDALGENPRVVLGLPTGRTPEAMYGAVVRACAVRRRCFAGAVTFNLDEYVGIPPEHPASYCSYMHRHLFDHVDLTPDHIHVPDGCAAAVLRDHPQMDPEQALNEECRRYEAAIVDAGGIDLCFLGLGRNGHIAFNEPGSDFASRTRVVELASTTRADNASHFADGEPPRRAITMGVATILAAQQVVLMATGPAKQRAVRRLATGVPTTDLPASALHGHGRVLTLVDRAAAGDSRLLP